MKRVLTTTACLFVLCGRGGDLDIAYLDAQGLGPIKFGATVIQLAAQLGEPLSEPVDPGARSCWYAESAKLAGVRFMIEDGRLRRIDVASIRIAAPGGIHVGDSEEAVKRRFGKRVAIEPHHYGGPKDHYLTVQLGKASAARFEASDGRVDMFYVGGPQQVQYVEGCL